jgi:hypothetical protein
MNRREFLGAGAGLAAMGMADPPPKKTVAAIITAYIDDRTLKSHAAVIVGRLVDGYYPNNVRTEPRTRIVSMYLDQTPPNDVGHSIAAAHKIPIYPTVAGALALGGEKLAVDAVLFIGEHGNYPTNDRGQKLYPRFELFSQIADVLRKSGRPVPVFSDKHLSWSWDKAKQMYDWSRELKFPLMAGSSVPVTVRVPALDLPLDCPLEHAVSVGYGDIDAYGFHTLEVLQCMVERRQGAETGVAAVEMLEGDAVWKWRASEAGSWSAPLLEAALSRAPHVQPGRPEDNAKNPVLFLLAYRDGFRTASYLLNGHVRGFLFAGKFKDQAEPVATHFGFSEGGRPLPHFDGFVYCIEEMFVTGKPLYPVERTLLTTGALSFLFESRHQKRRIETPQLKIAYRAPREAWFQRASFGPSRNLICIANSLTDPSTSPPSCYRS